MRAHARSVFHDLRFSDAELTRRIRSTFDPTPVFQVGTVTIGGKRVGVIHVEQHPGRPVMTTKQEGDVSEGDIYYRYPGQSSKIKYSDLRTLPDERDARISAELTPMLNRLVQLGPGRAMVADLAANEPTDGRRSIRIDKELAEQITFIKEGHFVERGGAPALRLVSDVHVGEGRPAIKKGIVTRAEMLADFLDDGSRADPIDYLRFAVEVATETGLPIRRFARLAGLDDVALLAFIEASAGLPRQKRRYREHALNPDAAFVNATGAPARWLDRIAAGEEIRPANLVGRERSGAPSRASWTRCLRPPGGCRPSPGNASTPPPPTLAMSRTATSCAASRGSTRSSTGRAPLRTSAATPVAHFTQPVARWAGLESRLLVRKSLG